MIKKLKFKKLLNEYRSLSYEDKFIDEVMKGAQVYFDSSYRTYCKNNNIDIVKLDAKNSERVQKIFSDTSELSLDIEKEMRESRYDSKHIFREIAKKLHPDTLSFDDPRLPEYEESFKKAANAIQDCRWGDLFDIADKYDLNLKDYGKINISLKEDIIRIQKQVNNKKDTYAWLLYQCEEDSECEENIIKKFLKHLFNV